ncbi:MAG: PadR family transcriptional regulator [Tissierellaceae bacterium]|jgi:PadR family transcriptional regulator PadR|nr:PadR family transcriptional regulator [Tissierellia bacterium]
MTLYKGQRQRQFPPTIGTTSFVKLYILHILIEKNCYGNRIKDEISERLNHKWTPSPGMIYPLLRELEEEGYINGWWEEPQKRSIRRYRITDEGIKHYKVIRRQAKESLDNSLYIVKTVLNDIYKEKY